MGCCEVAVLRKVDFNVVFGSFTDKSLLPISRQASLAWQRIAGASTAAKSYPAVTEALPLGKLQQQRRPKHFVFAGNSAPTGPGLVSGSLEPLAGDGNERFNPKQQSLPADAAGGEGEGEKGRKDIRKSRQEREQENDGRVIRAATHMSSEPEGSASSEHSLDFIFPLFSRWRAVWHALQFLLALYLLLVIPFRICFLTPQQMANIQVAAGSDHFAKSTLHYGTWLTVETLLLDALLWLDVFMWLFFFQVELHDGSLSQTRARLRKHYVGGWLILDLLCLLPLDLLAFASEGANGGDDERGRALMLRSLLRLPRLLRVLRLPGLAGYFSMLALQVIHAPLKEEQEEEQEIPPDEEQEMNPPNEEQEGKTVKEKGEWGNPVGRWDRQVGRQHKIGRERAVVGLRLHGRGEGRRRRKAGWIQRYCLPRINSSHVMMAYMVVTVVILTHLSACLFFYSSRAAVRNGGWVDADPVLAYECEPHFADSQSGVRSRALSQALQCLPTAYMRSFYFVAGVLTVVVWGDLVRGSGAQLKHKHKLRLSFFSDFCYSLAISSLDAFASCFHVNACRFL